MNDPVIVRNEMNYYPENLVLESTTICDMACKICPRSQMRRRPDKTMDFRLFKKIVNEVAEWKEKPKIWLAFMGEPWFHPDLPLMIRYINKKNAGKIHLNTNGYNLLRRKNQHAMMCGDIDTVYISVDANEERTYKKLRGDDDDFHTIEVGVEALIDSIKNWYHMEPPKIVMQFVVCEENRNEEQAFIDKWTSRGCYVKVRRKLGWGTAVESKDLDKSTIKRDVPCPWLMRQMIVLYDGTVAQCDADYNGEYQLGKLQGNSSYENWNSSLYEIWNGVHQERRNRHVNNDFNFEPCKDCNDWQVGLSEIYEP